MLAGMGQRQPPGLLPVPVMAMDGIDFQTVRIIALLIVNIVLGIVLYAKKRGRRVGRSRPYVLGPRDHRHDRFRP